MAIEKLKTAVLGLNQAGLLLLEAAAKSPCFDVLAVADLDIELAEKIANKHDLPAFDDYRQVLIQNKIDVLLVAAPLRNCEDNIRAAIKSGMPVFKAMPPALDFEQAAEMVRFARKNKAKYVTAVPGRFSPGFAAMRQYIAENGKGKFNLITARCDVPRPQEDQRLSWMADPKLAGGGVLLHDCYGIIDQIILNFGVPQKVYSLNISDAPDKQQRMSITEDTAIVTMEFADTQLANVITSRTFGPPCRNITLHSKEAIVCATDNSFTISDNLGNVLQQQDFDIAEVDTAQAMLDNFAEDVFGIEREEGQFVLPADCDLKSMAVIDSAYLSARTAMPEEPTKLLHIVKT